MLRLVEDNFNIPVLGTRETNASDIMNSFNFTQTPQPALTEPGNFVAPATSPTTTPTLTPSPSSPAHTPSTPSIPELASAILIIAVAVITSAFVILRKRKPKPKQ